MRRQCLAAALLALTLVAGCRPSTPPAAPDPLQPLRTRAATGVAGADELVRLGEDAYLKGDPLKAAEYAFQARQKDGASADAHNLLGVLYREGGDRKKALASFQEALKHQPGHAMARLNLGKLLTEAGAPEEALRILEPGTQPNAGLQPQLAAEFWLRMGQAERALDQLFKASGDFQKALELNPNLAEAHLALGMLDMDRGQERQALPALEKAYSLGERTVPCLSFLALTLMRVDTSPEAATRAEALLKEAGEPNNPPALFARALLLQRAQRHTEAEARLQQILQVAPRHEQALFALAETQRAAGKRQQATETMKRYDTLVRRRQKLASLKDRLASVGPQPRVLREYGVALLESGYPRPALAQFQEWARRYPRDAEAPRWVARARKVLEGGGG